MKPSPDEAARLRPSLDEAARSDQPFLDAAVKSRRPSPDAIAKLPWNHAKLAMSKTEIPSEASTSEAGLSSNRG